MDDSAVRRCWESNARAWTELVRAGYDVCRDYQNTPAFFAALPDVQGLQGVDIGCGDGHNTRLLAARGARVTALDVASGFVRAAATHGERREGIRYMLASALQLPFRAAAFDFATAFMSLMDVGAPERVLGEVSRVVRPGGFVQFSIVHPCFAPPHRKLVRDGAGAPVAVQVGRYFDRLDGEVERWLFGAAPEAATAGLRPFEVPRFHRTLGDWLNAIHAAGLHVERCDEPMADQETAAAVRGLADTRIVPNFILFRCRKC